MAAKREDKMVRRADASGQQARNLDDLLEEWRKSYPAKELQANFFMDGIVNEARYLREATRVLYVVLEPNSTNLICELQYGRDLRRFWCCYPSGKAFNLNLARWTSVLLDGEEEYLDIDPKSAPEYARKHLGRVAIMNLKKLGGTGKANTEAIALHAWRDRERIRQQVAMVNPTVVVTCGRTANRLFWWITEGDEDAYLEGTPEEDSLWHHDRFQVLPANHPSFRPKDPVSAFNKFVTRAKKGKIGRFGRE